MFKKKTLATLAANYNATSIFRRSKMHNKHLLKKPEWDVMSNNIRMVKVLNGRDVDEVNEQQDQMRDEAKIQAKRNKKRIKGLRKMQEELRQKFIDTNLFVYECEQKEKEVDKKIAAELQIQEKLKEELAEVNEKTDKLQKYHEEQLKPDIERMKIYEDVLQQVVDEMEIFKSKEDFLDRIEALLITRDEVSRKDSVTLKEIEDLKTKMVKLSNETTSMFAGLENEIADLEKQYEHTKKECLKWENVLAPTKDVIATKEKEMFMLYDQIQQMYLLLCARNGDEAVFKREQTEEQLDYIKREFGIILEIIDLAKEMTALETRSDIAEHGSGKSGIPRK